MLLGLLVPFLGTVAGSSLVFFVRRGINPTAQKAMLGFASGVMVAASVWSLLMPAMEFASDFGSATQVVPAAVASSWAWRSCCSSTA